MKHSDELADLRREHELAGLRHYLLRPKTCSTE
jgi:hypothetical protein